MNQLSILGIAKRLVLPLVAGALLAGCGGYGGGGYGALNNPVPMPMPHPSPLNGTLSTMSLKGAPGFVNTANHTVYVFDLDLTNPGHSTCSGACAANWPPVIAVANATLPAPWSTIARGDGGTQLTYKGRPLYTCAFDNNPVDTNGDGVNAFGGFWHIARP